MALFLFNIIQITFNVENVTDYSVHHDNIQNIAYNL